MVYEIVSVFLGEALNGRAITWVSVFLSRSH